MFERFDRRNAHQRAWQKATRLSTLGLLCLLPILLQIAEGSGLAVFCAVLLVVAFEGVGELFSAAITLNPLTWLLYRLFRHHGPTNEQLEQAHRERFNSDGKTPPVF